MKTTRIIALILALLMLCAALVACATPGDGSDTTVTQANPTDGTTADAAQTTHDDRYDNNGYLKDNLSSELDFANQTVNIMYWDDVERPEFEVKELTGTPINDAIYARNLKVEDRLKIKFNWTGTPGNFGNQAEFVKKAEASVNGGGTYDIFAGYSLTGSTLALNNLTLNLLELDHLDFDMPWWPESLISQATINDRLYFASGDISTNLFHMMYTMFYNKSILEQFPVEEPYDLVESGRWTLDKMMELSSGVYSDLNNNNTVDYGDRFGFMTIDLHFDAFYSGSDMKTVEKDENGLLKVAADFTSEKAINLVTKINTFIHTNENAFGKGTTSNYSSAVAFRDGQVLFTMDRAYISSGTLVDISDFKYGILPVCKYDEAQENYVTCMAFPYTLYSISTATLIPDVAAATLECMGSESYRQVTPVLFHESMKVRYSSDEVSARMFDIIRESVVIDPGRIFTTTLNNLTYSCFRNAIKGNQTTWSSSSTANGNVMNRLLVKVNDQYKK